MAGRLCCSLTSEKDIYIYKFVQLLVSGSPIEDIFLCKINLVCIRCLSSGHKGHKVTRLVLM